MGRRNRGQPPQTPSNRFRDRIKELRRVRAGDLKDSHWNFRDHGSKQIGRLVDALQRIGWTDALLAYEDGEHLRLFDGHARKNLDENEVVPVLVTDLTAEEAKQQLAVHDYIAELAEVDDHALGTLLISLEQADELVAEMNTHYSLGLPIDGVISATEQPPLAGEQLPATDEVTDEEPPPEPKRKNKFICPHCREEIILD